MKTFKLWSLLFVAAAIFVSCGGSNETDTGNFDSFGNNPVPLTEGVSEVNGVNDFNSFVNEVSAGKFITEQATTTSDQILYAFLEIEGWFNGCNGICDMQRKVDYATGNVVIEKTMSSTELDFAYNKDIGLGSTLSARRTAMVNLLNNSDVQSRLPVYNQEQKIIGYQFASGNAVYLIQLNYPIGANPLIIFNTSNEGAQYNSTQFYN